MADPILKFPPEQKSNPAKPRIKIAAEPPQGPVFLALPMDVLDAEADMDIAPTTYTN